MSDALHDEREPTRPEEFTDLEGLLARIREPKRGRR